MYRATRAEVAAALSAAVSDLGYGVEDVGLEEPPEGVDAVVASSVAFRLAAQAEAPPPRVAGELADAVDVAALTYVGRVETAGPYVNFHPSDAYFAETLAAAGDPDYGTLPDRDRSVVLEHTSANPTGPIHVGRARNPIIGDALARVLEYADDLAAAEAEIQAILQGLEAGEEATYERVAEVVDAVLGGMCETLSRLPAEFDEFVKETRFMRDGSTDDVVERLKELDCAVLEEEAWQLDLPEVEKNLVFLRSDGTSLYSTRDLAHHEWKLENYDEAVTVLGEDHKLQAAQLASTLALLGHDTDRLRSIHYSWVTLPEGGMSTREGTGVDLDDLLDEAIERAREEVEDRLEDRIRDDDLDAADVERIAHQVGIGAVRYDVVAKQPAKGITFEWERALDFEAQSAPYVQYVHARACGILAEADAEPVPAEASADALASPEERHLLGVIARFPAVIEDAAADLAPHAVATYTRTLAEAFNAFYRECPVLAADEERTRRARLALVIGARHTVANALDALGVAAPESM